MATAGDIIDLVQLTFSHASDEECLADLQIIHNELCFDFKLKPSTGTITTLVAGTREYTLPTGTGRVDQVRYHRSATRSDFKILIPTHVDKLDELDSRWRGKNNGEPQQFYIQNGKIGLVPPPDTATSGSYPQIQIDISSVETLADATVMPSSVISHQAWVDGVHMRVAARCKDDRYGIYRQAYQDERKRLGEQMNKFARDFKVQILPAHAGYGRRRV